LFQIIRVHQEAKSLGISLNRESITEENGILKVLGIPMPMDSIKGLIMQLTRETKESMDLIMGGLGCEDIDISELVDNFTLHDVGSSFFTQNKELLGPLQKRFIEKFVDVHADLTDQKGKIIPGTERCSVFIKQFRDVLEKLLTLMHLVSGLPARTTELQETLIANTSLARRNIFVFGDMVAISLVYNKVDQMKGGQSKLTRFLTVEVSQLLLQYLVYIRPLERVRVRV
jgi:hypothetical protein